jgi:hypothetical protein
MVQQFTYIDAIVDRQLRIRSRDGVLEMFSWSANACDARYSLVTIWIASGQSSQRPRLTYLSIGRPRRRRCAQTLRMSRCELSAGVVNRPGPHGISLISSRAIRLLLAKVAVRGGAARFGALRRASPSAPAGVQVSGLRPWLHPTGKGGGGRRHDIGVASRANTDGEEGRDADRDFQS